MDPKKESLPNRQEEQPRSDTKGALRIFLIMGGLLALILVADYFKSQG